MSMTRKLVEYQLLHTDGNGRGFLNWQFAYDPAHGPLTRAERDEIVARFTASLDTLPMQEAE
jgi:hypothetical protein